MAHRCSFIAIHLPGIKKNLQVVCIIESYKIDADVEKISLKNPSLALGL